MTLVSAIHDRMQNGRWRPFAISGAATLLVAAVHTGALNVLLVFAYSVHSLGG